MNLMTRALLATTFLQMPVGFDGDQIEISYADEASVPAAYKGLYTEKDGKWTLTGVKGMKTDTDVSKLSEALRKERNDHKAIRDTIKSKFGERTLDQVVADLDRIPELEALAEGNNNDPKKIDELVERRIKSRLAPLERELGTVKGQLTEATGIIDGYKGKDRTRAIHDAIRAAGTKAKVLPAAMEDALEISTRLFDIDDSGAVIIKDNVGFTPGSDPTAWFIDMQQKRPHWWGPSEGGGSRPGGGANGQKNPWAHDTWNMTEQAALFRADPARANALAAAAGTTIGGLKPAKK